MANFCSNCGASVDPNASDCPQCGNPLSGTANANSNTATGGMNGADILGTLVTVSLVGGLMRQLYFYNGCYYMDPYCRHPFASPHLILGMHRPRPRMGWTRFMGAPPHMGGLRGPMGGHHRCGPGGPMGGPRGPMGGGPRGPMGGGPRGRR